ncbi:hypothetical protein IEO21_04533 [Rhodonia placenta]|uniref:Uncharacterized protein n=2 Tax=Rhodonia placenta TaxID=104341 RepID=A0A1X6MSE3_9APHY|nr:hypothetical protein POSPLADRAFT_1150523 [Postia placenta MAD-698-R-SB12]KAF9815533.1 hypothetical protein IEO21_04533 [Postia placenta]OSX59297.1 hypothetical protein POSPLADRAFT_1150523 [Postia placenta MAD-698-R-SB12]
MSISLTGAAPFLSLDDPDTGPGELPKLPHISQATFVGILVAISGNVVISLALNCQKLAHKRLEREREQEQELQSQSPTTPGDNDSLATHHAQPIRSPRHTVTILETEPLLDVPDSPASSTYGTDSPPHTTHARPRKKRHVLSRLFLRKDDDHPYRDADASHLAVTHALLPVEVVPTRRDVPPKADKRDASEGDYLKSKLWWLGFVLMNIGELGNFVSYAFAPASIVAPLGTFALIANCIFAPLMLKERFRKRDFIGILIAILGAVTVVLSSNTSDVRLDAPGLIHAVAQRPFLIYTVVYIAGAIFLSLLSEREAGKRWVYVDVGLCALFGGFTVLSTKAISTLLTLKGLGVITEWVTYPIIAVLLGTGVGQIRYLNRALMRFDSKIVVPTQFVLFNLSAIVGSALLYGDFIEATFHQIVTFLYGCAATFAGVFIIAMAPSPGSPQPIDDESSTVRDVESEAGDTAGLASNASSLGRANHVRLVVPEDITTPSSSPGLRPRQSMVSMYGLSPAQVRLSPSCWQAQR